MKYAIRLLVTALIVASIGLGAYYFVNAPQSTLNTFTLLAETESEEHYTDYSAFMAGDITKFPAQISTLNSEYAVGAGHMGAYVNLEMALGTNYNYYKQFLLFVDDIAISDQQEIENTIGLFELASKDAYDTIVHFNLYQGDALTDTQRENMFDNVISKYQTKMAAYYNLVEALENFVLKYSFNNSEPTSLDYILLNVQKDFVNAILEFKLGNPSDLEILANDLSVITNMYLDINQRKPQTNSTVLSFIDEYKIIANKNAYFINMDKANYIHAQEGDEQAALQVVDTFLTDYDVE